MKFTLSTSGHFYREEEQIKKLEKLGFTFEAPDDPRSVWGHTIQDSPTIDINSIEELIKFIEEIDQEVIISKYKDDVDIEIYDDYRE